MKKIIVLCVFGISALYSSPKNLDFDKYRADCLSGKKDACYDLGDFFASGENHTAPVDNYEAVKYYKLSCKKGSGKGCYKMAQCYHRGKAVPISDSSYLKYIKKSCSNNFNKACKEINK